MASLFLVPLVCAALAGAVWGGLAGILKARAGTNEVISTLLLSFIAVWLVYWCVQSEALLRQPMTGAATLPESLSIPEAAQLPILTGDASAPLTIGLLIAIVLAALVGLVLTRSRFGFQLRAVGLNPVAAARAGFSFTRTVVIAMLIAGAFGGLAGGMMLLGEQYSLKSALLVGLWLRWACRRLARARLGDRRESRPRSCLASCARPGSAWK